MSEPTPLFPPMPIEIDRDIPIIELVRALSVGGFGLSNTRQNRLRIVRLPADRVPTIYPKEIDHG